MNVRQMLDREEADFLTAYPDPLTKGDPWTIGRGHTGPEVHPDLVWTQLQSDQAFDADITHAVDQCKHAFPWFGELNEPRQAVLIGMVFQMGLGRVAAPGVKAKGLLGFPMALGSMRDRRWSAASGELLDSDWARAQTPKRARRMARQMETGEWQ